MDEVKTKAMYVWKNDVAKERVQYRDAMSPAMCRVKRCLDVIASVLGMIVFSPLFLIYGAQNETYIEGWEKKTSKLLIYKRLCKI